VVARLQPHVEALRDAGGDTVPTFFDATTATALALFREASVDHAILEVGLGGRLDSTNAVSPAVCCITSIEREHTEILGADLASIAGEKAGILKPGVPSVCGALAPEALAVVEHRAAELGCPLTRLGIELEVSASGDLLDGVRVEIRDGHFVVGAALAVPGEHQAANAAIAVAAVRRLLHGSLSDTEMRRRFASGLAAARLPGRVEVLSREPWVIVDAAHTAASARALATVLARLALPVDFVLSISSGKDIGAILAALLPHAKSLTLTRAEPNRSLDPTEVAAAARAVRPELTLRIVPNPHLALRAAQEGQAPDTALCATGSVYLAGIARRVLRAPATDRVVVTRTSG
jgi:dihydrofolate synthase/folylpolyglutamate synthase